MSPLTKVKTRLRELIYTPNIIAIALILVFVNFQYGKLIYLILQTCLITLITLVFNTDCQITDNSFAHNLNPPVQRFSTKDT